MRPRPSSWLRHCLLAACGLLAVSGVLAVAVGVWLGSPDFRQRVEREASAALGVPVAVQGITLGLWPLPGAALQGLTLGSQPAITVARVHARPALGALLAGRPELAVLSVHGAALSQAAVDDLLQKLKQQSADRRGLPADSSSGRGIPVAIRRLVLDGVTWQGAKAGAETLAGEVRLSPALRPDSADLRVLAGRWQGTRLRLTTEAGSLAAGGLGPLDGTWQLVLDVGGGTVRGPLGLKTGGSGMQLTASLQTRGVALESLTGLRTLTGRLDADTHIQGQGQDFGALAQAVQTRTRFTVRNAVVNGLDLARAVTTAGLSRGGQTRLDTLDGTVTTQETPRGRSIQLSQIEARSGVLAAAGQVAISPAQQLSGRVTVDLPGGVIGVPLALGGTVAAPEVTLTRSAMLGAAVGTMVMPGVGTGAGARLGDRLGQGLKGLSGGK